MPDRLARNVTQAVPFFNVRDMAESLRFYVDGLGFERKLEWTPEAPDRIRWCWLEAGGGALMLQEYMPGHEPKHPLGAGASVCFMCRDALSIYRDAVSRNLSPQKPFVGNGLWVVSLRDPDGYRIDFESPADLPEDTEYDPGMHG